MKIARQYLYLTLMNWNVYTNRKLGINYSTVLYIDEGIFDTLIVQVIDNSILHHIKKAFAIEQFQLI